VIHWLTDPFATDFMKRALAVAVFVGVLSPIVGTWIVLRRLAYLGDAMSHATLAGVGIAFAAGASVLLGALGAGIVMAMLLLVLSANRRLGQDAIIGVIETAMFSIGVIVIGRVDTGVELSHFLFGQVLTVTRGDVIASFVLTLVAVGVIVLMFGDLRMATFDPVHARQVGVRVGLVHGVLLVLLAITIVVSLRTVGTLMSVAMLVTPAATARLVTRSVATMTLVGAGVGLVSAVTGLILQYHLDSPPGATIALVAVAIFAVVYAVTLPRRLPHHVRA
jgi:manganese/iron transport system permease protein